MYFIGRFAHSTIWLRFLQHRYIKILKRRGVLFQPLFYFLTFGLSEYFHVEIPFFHILCQVYYVCIQIQSYIFIFSIYTVIPKNHENRIPT